MLHRLDPEALDLPELGAPGRSASTCSTRSSSGRRSTPTAGGGVPVITLAFAWLRHHRARRRRLAGRAGAGRHRSRQLHVLGGRARRDHRLGARALGRPPRRPRVDPRARHARAVPRPRSNACATTSAAAASASIPNVSRYFRVLAQVRATIGTLAGLRTHDARGEIAWQLIYNTLHTRVLGESLAEVTGVPVPAAHRRGRRRWSVSVDLRHRPRRPARRGRPGTRRPVRGDARQGHRPVAEVPPRRRRAGPGTRRRRAGPTVRAARRSRSTTVDAGRRALCVAIDAGTIAPERRSPTASTRPHATPRSCDRRWACSPTVTSRPSTSSQEAVHDRHDRR